MSWFEVKTLRESVHCGDIPLLLLYARQAGAGFGVRAGGDIKLLPSVYYSMQQLMSVARECPVCCHTYQYVCRDDIVFCRCRGTRDDVVSLFCVRFPVYFWEAGWIVQFVDWLTGVYVSESDVKCYNGVGVIVRENLRTCMCLPVYMICQIFMCSTHGL